MQGMQDFEAKVETILAQARENLYNIRRKLDGAQDEQVVTLMEEEITQLKQNVGQSCQQVLMEVQVDVRDPVTCVCECGQHMSIKDYRKKTIYGLHGQFSVRRRYYVCHNCSATALPLDKAMNLDGRFTEKLTGAANLLGVTHSSREGSFILRKLTGISISHSTLHKMTVEAGTQLQQIKENTLVGDQVPSSTDVAYISADGVLVNTTGGWREMKLGCIYDEGNCVRHYLATMQPCEPFGQQWRDLARFAGLKNARTIIAIADGAPWIWNQVRTRFPFADVEIVDFYHAAENIAKAANQMYGEGTDKAAKWLREKRPILRHQGGRELIRVLTRCRRYRKEDPALIRLVNYLRDHTGRMEYPDFHRRGYDLGSGLIESSCKNVVQARLKGPGMKWKEDTATAVAELRGLLLCGYCDDFQQMRRAR